MVIKSKEELKTVLSQDRKQYFDNKITAEIRYRLSTNYLIYKYICNLRKYEYLCYKRDASKNSLISRIRAFAVKRADRKKNKLGTLLGIEITPNYVDMGIRICHPNVILNGFVGKNCVFHGNNVVGNKFTGKKDEIPHIGSNVDVGTGAIIIGDVTIADDCVIGAGSVVTKSFLTPGTVIAGVPAKSLAKDKKD